MSFSRERPAFVLPWIAVILASFASLPLCFGGRSEDGERAVGVPVVPADLLAGDRMGPQQAPPPTLSVGDLGVSAAVGAAADAAATLAGFGPGAEPVSPFEAQGSEATPDEPREPGEALPTELPAGPVQQPFRQRYGPAAAVTSVEAPPSVRRPSRASAARTAAEVLEATTPLLRELADGRTELRLSPAAFAFLAAQGLMPRGAEVRPAALDARELPRLRAEAEVLAEEEPTAERVAAERRARLKRVKRLLASDPGRLVEFLAVLEPGELRALVLQLRGRGLSMDRLLTL